MARHKEQKSFLEQIVGGVLVLGIVTTLVAFRLIPTGFMVLGLLFGAIPLVKGTRLAVRAVVQRKESRQIALDKKAEGLHRVILRVAQAHGGKVTPTLVALNSNLTLDEADEALGAMASKGFAEMNIKDSGTIEYFFPELTKG